MTVHVIGGGIAGLVAAIDASERGAAVSLYEAAPQLGGRAVGANGSYRTNLGPHVLYQRGALGRWLATRDLTPPLVALHLHRTFWIRPGAPSRRTSGALLGAVRHVRHSAPDDQSFRAWGHATLGVSATEQLSRLAGLFTFHHDPGELAASFVWDRVRTDFLQPWAARTVAGGWEQIIAALAQRATERGVRIETNARVRPSDFPNGPTIVATSLAVSSRLLDDASLTWFGARTALLDIAVRGRPPGGRVLGIDIGSDLRSCVLMNRSSADDPTVAPIGQELWCGQMGIADDDDPATATARIEAALTAMDPGWQSRETWRQSRVILNASGAVDPPGTSWRDRPAIDRGDDLFVCGDMSAAPGLLAEVAVNSATHAGALAAAADRQRSFAPGWPGLPVTPQHRIELLAATLARSCIESFPLDEWRFEPYEEEEPGVVVSELADGWVLAFVRDDTGGLVWGLVGARERDAVGRGRLAKAVSVVSAFRLRRHARRRLRVARSGGD